MNARELVSKMNEETIRETLIKAIEELSYHTEDDHEEVIKDLE